MFTYIVRRPDEQKRRSKLSERGSLVMLEHVNDELTTATEISSMDANYDDAGADGAASDSDLDQNRLLDESPVLDQASAANELVTNSNDLDAPLVYLGHQVRSPRLIRTSIIPTETQTPQIEVVKENSQLDTFKQLRVSMKDPCSVVLTVVGWVPCYLHHSHQLLTCMLGTGPLQHSR